MRKIKNYIKSKLGYNLAVKMSVFRRGTKYVFFNLFRINPNKVKYNLDTLRRDNCQVFFGYYDVSPFNKQGDMILSNSYSGGDKLDLGYFALKANVYVFYKLSETSSWNYQMGCRLQWLNDGNFSSIIYNDYSEGEFKAVVFDFKNKQIGNYFCKPIFAQAPNGMFYLSLDFTRLGRLRAGYGYNNIQDKSRHDLIPNDNGVWYVDMKSNVVKLLFSIEEVANYLKRYDGEQYINHIMISPKSDKFIFFHVRNIGDKRIITLLLFDINLGTFNLINNSGHISHCNWIDNNKFIAYATEIDLGTGFIIYDIQGEITLKKLIRNKMLKNDGHPTYNPIDNCFLIDTYPDKYGMQTLMKYNIDNDEVHIISKEFMPSKYFGEHRCDLHPRYSSSYDMIAIDSIEKGERVMKIKSNKLS